MRTDEASPVEQVELPQEAPAKAKKPNLKTQLADMTERAEKAEARLLELEAPEGELLSWRERAELAEGRVEELQAALLPYKETLALAEARIVELAGRCRELETALATELHARAADLAAALAQAQEAEVKVDPSPRVAAGPGKGGSKPQYEVLGHSITAVCRWMGAQGWTAEEAQKVVNALGIQCSPATVKIQVKAGAKGERGAPAELTAEQAAELERLKDAEA